MSKRSKYGPVRQLYSDEDSGPEQIPLTSTPSASSAPPAFGLQTIQKGGKKVIRRISSSPSETDSNETARNPYTADPRSSASSPEKSRGIPTSSHPQQVRARNHSASGKASIPPNPTKSPKKKRKRYQSAAKEIQRLQRSTELLIPRRVFSRTVREVLQRVNERSGIRWQPQALEALHEASEYYLVHLLEVSYLLTLHSGRVTLLKKDMQLARRIWGDV